MPRPVVNADELWERSLQLLARRAHARAELERKLRRYKPEPAWMDQVLSRLEDRGLLDDRRFARDTADALVRGGRSGPGRISARLRNAGVASGESGEAMAELEVDWVERCRALAKERVARGADLRDPKARARLVRFLAGRGFQSGVIFRVLRELGLPEADELEPEG